MNQIRMKSIGNCLMGVSLFFGINVYSFSAEEFAAKKPAEILLSTLNRYQSYERDLIKATEGHSQCKNESLRNVLDSLAIKLSRSTIAETNMSYIVDHQENKDENFYLERSDKDTRILHKGLISILFTPYALTRIFMEDDVPHYKMSKITAKKEIQDHSFVNTDDSLELKLEKLSNARFGQILLSTSMNDKEKEEALLKEVAQINQSYLKIQNDLTQKEKKEIEDMRKGGNLSYLLDYSQYTALGSVRENYRESKKNWYYLSSELEIRYLLAVRHCKENNQ